VVKNSFSNNHNHHHFNSKVFAVIHQGLASDQILLCGYWYY